MTLEAPLDGAPAPVGMAAPDALDPMANSLLGAPAPEKPVKEQIFDKLNNGLKNIPVLQTAKQIFLTILKTS